MFERREETKTFKPAIILQAPTMVVCCSSRCSGLKVWVALYMLCFLFFICEADPRSYVCPNTTTYTPNSTYHNNLKRLLSTLSSNYVRNILFYIATAGDSALDRVYGFFMCRGDVTFDTCHDCVVTATKEIVEKCPKEKNVRAFYDLCMVRYENQSIIFSTMDASLAVFIWNPGNVSELEPDRFAQLLENTMNELATRASSDQSGNDGRLRGFATGEANFTSFHILYNLVQCTPDLSGSDCNRCLSAAIGHLRGFAGNPSAWILLPSCNIRYSTSPFYNSIAAPPPPSPTPIIPPPPPAPGSPTSPGGNGRISIQVIIAIVIAVVVSFLLFTLGFCTFLRRRAKKYDSTEQATDGNEIFIAESLQYDLRTIGAATNNFSAENKVGEGGFGSVFKGALSNGQEIAVKRLSKKSGQGAQEFKTEVVLVAKLQHRNLVRLVGFCLEQEEKILIYEFVSNKSLDYFLFDAEKRKLLNWSLRYKIIGGIAQGILYLHEHSRLKIVHRDLKASNVLLDGDMNPKISDFGTVRIFGIDQSQANTNRIVGTFGYMAPEYVMHGEFSVKSDVFSFGVLILEIVTGKKSNSFYQSGGSENLLSHAWKHWQDGTPLDLVDPTLGDSVIGNEVIRCIHIGLLCVQEVPDERPTMTSVALMLNSYSVPLSLPHQPAFFLRSRRDAMLQQLELDSKSTWSVNEVSISELLPR